MKSFFGYLRLFLICLIITSGFQLISPQKIFASGCSLDPSTDRLAIVSSSQQFPVGSSSLPYSFDIEGPDGQLISSNCQVDVQITVSPNNIATVSPANGYIEIAAGQSQSEFYLTGQIIGTATVNLTTTSGPLLQSLQGTNQPLTVTPDAPVASLIDYHNNPLNQSDTLSGKAGATSGVSGIDVYGLNSGSSTLLSGSPFFVNTDGSFGPIDVGVDQYREMAVSAVAPGGNYSSQTVVNASPDFPAPISGLSVSHDLSDYPDLAWSATGSGNLSYQIYRTNYGSGFSAVDLLTTVGSNNFTDKSAVVGQAYQYAVKSYDSTSQSSSPEYSNLVTWKADIYQASISPDGGLNLGSVTKSPIVSFSLTPEAAALIGTADAPVVDFINQKTGKISQLPIVAQGNDHFSATPTGNGLPDGLYQVIIFINNQESGPLFINDQIILSNNYYIDLTAPQAPSAGLLRYDQSTGQLTGLAGAIGGGDQILFYKDDSLHTLIGSAVAATDGSFSFSVPAGNQDLNLWSKDQNGNMSLSGTSYSLYSAPTAISAQNISLGVINKAHQLSGSLNSLPYGEQVFVYSADPVSNPNLAPLYSTSVLPDGSFNLSIPGYNALPSIWVAAWDGLSNGPQLVISQPLDLKNEVNLLAVSGFDIRLNNLVANINWQTDAQADYYLVTIYRSGDSQPDQSLVFNGQQASGVIAFSSAGLWQVTITPENNLGDSGQSLTVSVQASNPPPIVLAQYTNNQSSSPSSNTPSVASTTAATPPPATHAQTLIFNQDKSANNQASPTSSRNWTGWILLIGLIIIIAAGLVSYRFLFSGQALGFEQDENKEKQVKKPGKRPTKSSAKSVKDPPTKPRW